MRIDQAANIGDNDACGATLGPTFFATVQGRRENAKCPGLYPHARPLQKTPPVANYWLDLGCPMGINMYTCPRREQQGVFSCHGTATMSPRPGRGVKPLSGNDGRRDNVTTMQVKYLIRQAMLAGALAATLIGATTSGATPKSPNIVVIFTDDHGYADLGCQQVLSDVKTPHIDALAAGGVRMTDGYVTAPQCVPSRGGLISGQYQNRFGLESNPQNGDPDVMSRFGRLQTIAERLKTAGYATGMAGKWHLGPDDRITEHGFDKVFFKHSNAPGYWNMNLQGADITPAEQKGGGYHLELISSFACSFIERYRDRPFFFYLAYRAPHVPLDPPQEYLNRFPGDMPERRRKALAMLSAVDDGVGRLLGTLRKLGLEENTLIFLISDNGAPLKIHKLDAPGGGPGWDGSLNTPMNGEKGMLTEGGIRTPFVVYWKDTLPAGLVFSHPVISLDVAATANALAGLPDDPALDGVNLVPYLTGERTGAPHEVLYWRWLGQSAIRRGPWKYLRSDQREYLFNLADDPEEQSNLLASHPQIAKDLHAELGQWAGTLLPPGIGGLKSEGMSRAADQYYSWYLDGKRDTPARASSERVRRRERTQSPRRNQ